MNLWQLPAFSENGTVHGVVEIPAGTNKKNEYDRLNGILKQDLREGRGRQVNFLPYPVNYGFVPSTLMDKGKGGDGDPLDVLILAESLPASEVYEVIPIGLLRLKDLGEQDHKVLAVPADPALRIIAALNWSDFQRDYSAIRHILELFFLYYDGLGVMTLLPWGNEAEAISEIKKWVLSK